MTKRGFPSRPLLFAVLLSISPASGGGVADPASPARVTPESPGEIRRVAIRASASVLGAAELERLSVWSRRQAVQIEAAGESVASPAGWETVRMGMTPASPDLARRLSRFGVTASDSGFDFDGRSYRAASDAIAVRDPGSPAETLVLGNGKEACLRLAARRIFSRDNAAADYQVVSGDLGKSGRFQAPPASARSPLSVDRASDRDEIAGRDRFIHSLVTEQRGGVRWQFSELERPAVPRFEAILERFLRGHRTLPLTIRVFPDPVTKAHFLGSPSSRPADFERDDEGLRIDVDASAPAVPDLVSATFASAGFAAEDPRLLARPVLLHALGARACGFFWEREIAGFAAFTRRAGVEPTIEEVMTSAPDVSPVLAVGTAAAWLDAGVAREGEAAVLRRLVAPEGELAAALRRWEADALTRPVTAPHRRPLPPGFLRGVSYSMSNSVETGYASPRSRETILRLARLGANAISVMPFAFARDAERPTLSFVHRSPQGETDEAIVRAVADARAAGMSAMLKPQIWVGDDEFVGRIRMRSDDDWNRWFALYRRLVVHYAIVAEASGAAIFCVGTELSGTEQRVQQWRDTIAAARLATGAALTYASNWAAGAPGVGFWDALDAIGVDFYDSLGNDPEASDDALAAGVRGATRGLESLARQTGKPVLFTEAGFPLVRAAWIAPHDENTGRQRGSADAARSIAAVYRALENEVWWKGVYWWKVFSSGREARPDEGGFNVLGGAPEGAVRQGFERIARERGK